MWTSTKNKNEIKSSDMKNQWETCAYRRDARRQHQTACKNGKTTDGPAYVSSPAMSAMDIYPY